MSRLATLAVSVVAGAIAPVASVGAQTLGGTMTVDNAFTAFLGTSATVQGTPIASGTDWQAGPVTFGPVALVPGQNYWLQVAATNEGGPGGVLGDFVLTGPFAFADGTQTLSTNPADWTARTASFAGPTVTVTDDGANSASPVWGTIGGISSTTHWIWVTPSCGVCTLYFSTPIVGGQTPGVVPEPTAWALLGGGLVGLGAIARRRRA